ncbi:MAG: NAD+ synthase [Limnobacter sp. CACIAM 66H1]|uniref:NAD+ synthase n=1 Tax=Limnobacter sp. CACIAM 66H1 TaxID=1813033 RepID=UPI0007A89A07|nr:NAD+ synthase [Limnobacter sp. CACIAM 66H1]KYP12646.1 MAG: NAD+ synthase [Limnobacter sp. CACIAM 66H1]
MSLSRVRLAIAQLNLTVGDLKGNCAKILDYAHKAATQGVRILLTPELSITGYPPEDLLLRPSFQRQTDTAFDRLRQDLASLDLYVVVGHPVSREGELFNAASVLYRGQVVGMYHKHDLPNREVFDEQRYFTPDNRPLVFEVDGIRFGLNICEDTWNRYAPEAAASAGAEVLLVPNASPYHMGKQTIRQSMVAKRVQETGMAIVYANMLGGQDELVFDGASFAMDGKQHVAMRLPQFQEALAMLDAVARPGEPIVLEAHQPCVPELDLTAQVYEALKMGVHDYVTKNRFPGAIIGLSGGVDSAITLAIAVDALGADKVRAVMMPSPYTADISLDDSRDMVKRLGIQYDEISIQDCMKAFDSSLASLFKGLAADTTEENLQARIRGTMLMAISNKTGRIVLTTGNKSEMATGYCTLYGDMAGGFAVIKDIFKTLVYQLCEYRNSLSEIIPTRIITRPPSAELRPDQVDQDSLPPYDVLDAILARYMEKDESVENIIASGFQKEDVFKAVKLLRINEYKRRQAPVGIRVTHRAFGRDWRYPITSKFNDLEGFQE